MRWQGLQQRVRQTLGLGPEQQAVAFGIGHVGVALRAAGLYHPQPRSAYGSQAVRHGGVLGHASHLVIIQAGAAQARFVDLKAQLAYEVQPRASVGAEADGIARIGRDFGFVQQDVKHGDSLARHPPYASSTGIARANRR